MRTGPSEKTILKITSEHDGTIDPFLSFWLKKVICFKEATPKGEASLSDMCFEAFDEYDGRSNKWKNKKNKKTVGSA